MIPSREIEFIALFSVILMDTQHRDPFGFFVSDIDSIKSNINQFEDFDSVIGKDCGNMKKTVYTGFFDCKREIFSVCLLPNAKFIFS